MTRKTSHSGDDDLVTSQSRWAPLQVSNFRLLLSAQLISEIGDWSARVALQLLVLERTGNAALSALVIAVSLAPWIGLGQVLASIGDRYPRRAVLVVSDLSRAMIFLLIAAVEIPVPMILVLAFLAGCFDPPFEASRSALIPQLVGTTLYGHALALAAHVSNMGLLSGYVLGGGLSGWLGPRGALLVNAGTFLLSSFLVFRLSNDPGNPARRPDVRAAVQFVLTDRVVLTSVIVYGLVAFFGMSVEGIAAPYAVDELGLNETRVGLLLATIPLGTILGTLAIRPHGSDRKLVRLSGVVPMVAGALSLPIFALGLEGVAAYVGFFGVGVCFAAAIPTNTAAGRRIPDEIRASTFGILQGVVVGAHATGAAFGGVLAAGITLRFATIAGAGTLFGLGLVVLLAAPWLAPDSQFAKSEG